MSMFSSKNSGTDMLMAKILETPAIAESIKGFQALAKELQERQLKIEAQLDRVEIGNAALASYHLTGDKSALAKIPGMNFSGSEANWEMPNTQKLLTNSLVDSLSTQ